MTSPTGPQRDSNQTPEAPLPAPREGQAEPGGRDVVGASRTGLLVMLAGIGVLALVLAAAGFFLLRPGQDGDEGGPAAARPEGATASASDDGGPTAPGQEGTGSSPEASATEQTQPPPPPAPSLDELRNAALLIPPGCADYMYFDGEYGGADHGTTPVQFTDGEAPGNAPSSSYLLGDETAVLEADGRALTIVAVHCFGGGSYTYPALAAYDGDLELAGWMDTLDENYPQPGTSPKPYLEDLAVTGSTLTYTHGGIELFGDQACSACEKSGTATMSWQWTGDGFISTDVVVHTPTGDVRQPSVEDAQAVADLLIAGDDAAADYFIEGTVNPPLVDGQTDFSTLGEDGTLDFGRADVVPPGTRVDSCEVIGGGTLSEDFGYGSFYGPYFMRDGSEITSSSMARGTGDAAYETHPGDVVCLLQNDQDPPLGEFYDQSGFHLILQGTDDGSVVVRVIGLGLYGAEI